MAKHHDKHHENHKQEHHPKKQGLHKDWRTWAVVILMLAAMVIYVLSLDESVEPGEGGEQPRVPAAE